MMDVKVPTSSMLDEIESTKVHKVEEGVRKRKKKEDTEWTKASLKQLRIRRVL